MTSKARLKLRRSGNKIDVELDASSWTVPSVLKSSRFTSSVERQNFASIFNVGVGMACCVSLENSLETTALLAHAGEDVSLIGKLIGKHGDEACVIYGI